MGGEGGRAVGCCQGKGLGVGKGNGGWESQVNEKMGWELISLLRIQK